MRTGMDNPNLKYPQQKRFCRNVRLFYINKGLVNYTHLNEGA